MSLSKAEHDELCCVYAGLLLFDDKAEITADKMNKLITASGNTVDSYYPEFFAKYLSSVDLNALLTNVGSGAGAGAVAGGQAAPQKEEAKGKDAGKGKEKPKEAPKQEEEEEGAGFGDLFG